MLYCKSHIKLHKVPTVFQYLNLCNGPGFLQRIFPKLGCPRPYKQLLLTQLKLACLQPAVALQKHAVVPEKHVCVTPAGLVWIQPILAQRTAEHRICREYKQGGIPLLSWYCSQAWPCAPVPSTGCLHYTLPSTSIFLLEPPTSRSRAIVRCSCSLSWFAQSRTRKMRRRHPNMEGFIIQRQSWLGLLK